MAEENPDAPESQEQSENQEASEPLEEPKVQFEVIHSCLRCGTVVSNAELNRLPEIKCICGFRVFTKVRPPIVKTINAI